MPPALLNTFLYFRRRPIKAQELLDATLQRASTGSLYILSRKKRQHAEHSRIDEGSRRRPSPASQLNAMHSRPNFLNYFTEPRLAIAILPLAERRFEG